MLPRRLFGGLASLLSTISSLPRTTATGFAGAYERVGTIYQTYRIAVATWGVDQQKILPQIANQPGIRAKGGADFRDLIKYIDGVDVPESWFEEEEIDLKDPDPDKAAIGLYYYENSGKLTELISLPKLFAVNPGEVATWPTTISRVGVVLKDAHDTMQAKGQLDKIRPFRDRLAQSYVEILRFRQSETEATSNGKKGAIRDIKDKWPAAVPFLRKDKWHLEPSVEIYSIDVEKTIANSPSGLFTPEEVNTWLKEYGSREDDKPAAKNHFAVMVEHKSIKSTEKHLLDTNNTC